MNKTRLLIVGLIIAIVILIILISRQKATSEQSVQPQLTPIPMATAVFGVESIQPEANKLQEISSGTPIIVTFNEAVDPDSLEYTASLAIEIQVEFSGNKAIFKPKTYWPIGQEITISIKQAKSKEGLTMTKPYQFTINPPQPTE